MLKTTTLTCIICPNGCELQVDQAEDDAIQSICGATCRRGEDYARQEMTRPSRTISTSVLLEGGELPLASVRLTAPVPREKIFEVMAEIGKCTLHAPVSIGQVVIHDVLGLNADVIVTKSISPK